MSHPHEPTDLSKAEVKALASFGITQEEIARYLEIDVKTMYKYYREELDKSSLRANAAVARILFEKATIERDLSAVIFWLKTRARWATAKSPEDDLKDKQQITLMEKLIDKL